MWLVRRIPLIVRKDKAPPIGPAVFLGKLDVQVTLEYGAKAVKHFPGWSQEPGSGERAENLTRLYP